MGQRFFMQRLDLDLRERLGNQCPTTYLVVGFAGASNGVEGVIGI